MGRAIFIPLFCLMLCGCGHTIGYKLTKADRWIGPKIDGTVCVRPFSDCALVMTNREEDMDDGTWRTNYREGYKGTNLSAQVTAMITKHLAYSGLFTKVVSSTETNSDSDWFLSGTLADFQVHGRINQTAEAIQTTSAGFGLIGALVGTASTAKMTSEIKTQVKLDNLNLTDKSGQDIRHDSITISKDVKVDFNEANEVAIFNFPDQALKDAVNEMIRRLGNSSLTNHISSPAR